MSESAKQVAQEDLYQVMPAFGGQVIFAVAED